MLLFAQGYGRSAGVQGLFQLAAIGLTLAIAIISGLFTGEYIVVIALLISNNCMLNHSKSL